MWIKAAEKLTTVNAEFHCSALICMCDLVLQVTENLVFFPTDIKIGHFFKIKDGLNNVHN